jgi:hypothetical protein
LESKKHERARKVEITNIAKFTLEAFADGGKSLSKEAKAAITQVFLRSGAHVLARDFTMVEMEQLLSDLSTRNREIEKFEGMLQSQFAAAYIDQAKKLAYYKVTGINRSKMLMMNAANIVNMHGTSHAQHVDPKQAVRDTKVVESLIALYALHYSDTNNRNAAADVLRRENQRTDGNGVQFLLGVHEKLDAESRDRLFAGGRIHMVHGYTPEIYNPHTTVIVADDIEGKDLMNQGYTQGALVPKDPFDPDQSQKRFYVLRGGGLQPHVTGVVAYDGKRAKGSEMHSGYLNTANQGGRNNAASNAAQLAARTNVLPSLGQATSYDPRSDRGEFMAPVLDTAGNIVNWRYLMRENTKDRMLERDNRFEQVIGSLAGAVLYKPLADEQNTKAIEAMYDLYKAEYALQPDAYIEISAQSTDPEMRELWKLLPDDTQQVIRDVWGTNGLVARKDSLDIVFGYRKLSLSTMLARAKEERDFRQLNGMPTDLRSLDSLNNIQKLAVGTIEAVFENYARLRKGMNPQDARDYAKRAAVVVAKGEQMWQEIVSEAKDIIVVKTGVVLLGNIISNVSLLAVQGVPMKDIAHHHLVALRGAMSYQTDSEELARLRALLETGYTQGRDAEIQREIVRLEDAIARNPVRELIDAGLMPTIVEDVNADDDIYSYKNMLEERFDSLTSKMPEGVKKAGRFVYMAHDTKLYQGLSRITQLSDFVARYTLYQHLISRKKNPLSRADAVIQASDSFVNYDIPMQRSLQYLDDMGIMMFTKYFLRIQRVLMKTAAENPARVLMLLAADQYLDLNSIVLDSSWFTRIGNNPLEEGAFKFINSLDDLATVSVPMELVR